MLDFGSYAVTLVGHRHPDVVRAVRHQLDQMPTSTRVLANPATAALGGRLVGLLQPSRFTRVWLGLNGSDVVEVALKLARVQTGRGRVLAVEGGFHGKTLGALAATWDSRYRRGVEYLLPPVTHLPPNDPTAVRREAAASDVAALLFEPIQAEGGVRPLFLDTLRAWVADARAAGVFIVADEIQVGLRRCGPTSLAVASGLDPDAVLLGKHLGGGVMPLSAMVCTDKLYEPLLSDPFWHTSTFSGHPLSCAAALASLDVIESLVKRGREVSDRMSSALAELADRHADCIVALRGLGLLWGLELAPEFAGRILVELTQRGLLISPCLGRPEVLRLLPPMVTSDTQVDGAARILDAACRASKDSGGR
jgi:putrescine aminotransferase